MTALKQNFTSYAGDDALPIFTVRDASGNTIDISTSSQIEWIVSRDAGGPAVLTKLLTLGGIVFVGGGTTGQFSPVIREADTEPLTGFYFHRAIITDQGGLVTTVTLGRWQVGPAPLATYSGDPSISPRDAVRFWISDTDVDNAQIFDAEIDYTISIFPNPMLAAAQCARNLQAKYARKPNKRVGDLQISWSDIAKAYATLAADLEARGNTFNLQPYSGGTSWADRFRVNSNTDRVKPPFRGQHQFDNRSGKNNTTEEAWNQSDGS